MNPPNHDKLRNSLPPLLALMQGWLESEKGLRELLELKPDQSLKVLRLRRNYKFRKLTLQVGKDRYVCYRHYWPRGLRNLAWFSEQARLAGVQVPQPLSTHTDLSDLIKHRAFSLVFPYIVGQPIGPSSPESALEALGEQLGRLHGITADRHGPLMTNFARRDRYWTAQQKYWQRALRQIQQKADFANSGQIRNLHDWLLDHGAFLENLRCYNLTHGDPANGNFLQGDDGKLYLIDCDRAQFEPAAMELANALLQGYCAHDLQRRLILAQAWMQDAPADAMALWERHSQFFLAAALLWRSQRKLQWASKRTVPGRSLQRSEQAWRTLLQVISAQPSGWRESLALLNH